MFPATWLDHQRRDEYWKKGSVCEDWSAIACPVFAVGGWLDGYTQTIFRLVENLKAPCKGLVGPWGHKEPQRGVPGPAIGFLQECVRWWDQYLKEEDRGIDRDPAMRVWLQDYVPPQPHFLERPGRWLAFKEWPTAKLSVKKLNLAGGRLGSKRIPKTKEVGVIRSPLTVGIKAQEWCPYGQGRIAAESATDQREDDGGSLCRDSEPLADPINIVGEARANLRIAADKAQALVAVRLNDISPDGTSALISFGLLNLAHRNGSEHPSPLKPGKFYDVEILLKPIAQTVPKGHRLRVAISSSYWPMAWPSPENATLSVDLNATHLELPVLPAGSRIPSAPFQPAEYAQAGAITVSAPARETRRIDYDVESESTVFRIESDDGRYVIDEIGTEIGSTRFKTYAVGRHDPLSAATTVSCSQTYRRGDWDVRVDAELAVICDQSHFQLNGKIRAYERGKPFRSRDFVRRIRRDCM
jgi:predicted acyl esterase